MLGQIHIRISQELERLVRADLIRPHPYASERIGFVSMGRGTSENNGVLLLSADYHPVADDEYIDDPDSGARIGSVAIRRLMQRVLDYRRGIFHVHMHPGRGLPALSHIDTKEIPRLVDCLQSVGPQLTHGILLLSEDSSRAWVNLPERTSVVEVDGLSVVGYPMVHVRRCQKRSHQSPDRFSRQSFLGEGSQRAIEQAVVGIAGLSGGGSHIVQQLAHIGVKHYRVFDADIVTDGNLNRLVGSRADDVDKETLKSTVAERTIRAVVPDAEVIAVSTRWQDFPDLLRGCDIVFGCVDSFIERQQLESICRRYLIPLIDIGMDVHQIGGNAPRMAGQVILSMPGGPCMFCLGFLSDERLAEEAARYGDVGERPQVIWPNAILASTAIGIAIDLLTGWTRRSDPVIYHSYDGNTGALTPHIRLTFLPRISCRHYPLEHSGDPIYLVPQMRPGAR